jgi:CHASE2 domain-containing sensor protein
MITTQKEPVEKAVSEIKVCSLSVQSERMTFDSSIFNHYEALPVKEIYLYSMKIPYENWSELKNMDDVITEANPYIEDIVSSYVASKIKFQLFSFIFLMLAGVYFVFKIVASNKSSKKRFFVVSIIISVLYLSASVALLNAFPAFVMPLSAVSSGILLLVYVIISLLNYRLAKW